MGFEDGLAAAMTIGQRLPILWWGMVSPSPSANAEARRMVSEKQLAFAEGMMGAQAELMKLAMTPWWLWTRNAAAAVSHAATGPASRQVRANARRLGGKG